MALLYFNIVLLTVVIVLSLQKILVLYKTIVLQRLSENRQVPVKYVKSSVPKNQADNLVDKISGFHDSFFLNPDLNLENMASFLGCTRHHLSQVINEEFSMSFTQYTNERRLNVAVLLLTGNPDWDIELVSIKSGFTSKATFYRVFKTRYHVSPAAYREQQ